MANLSVIRPKGNAIVPTNSLIKPAQAFVDSVIPLFGYDSNNSPESIYCTNKGITSIAIDPDALQDVLLQTWIMRATHTQFQKFDLSGNAFDQNTVNALWAAWGKMALDMDKFDPQPDSFCSTAGGTSAIPSPISRPQEGFFVIYTNNLRDGDPVWINDWDNINRAGFMKDSNVPVAESYITENGGNGGVGTIYCIGIQDEPTDQMISFYMSANFGIGDGETYPVSWSGPDPTRDAPFTGGESEIIEIIDPGARYMPHEGIQQLVDNAQSGGGDTVVARYNDYLNFTSGPIGQVQWPPV